MASSVEGKVAIITGASRGVGQAVALKFAEAGVHVAVGAKTTESTPRTPGTIFDTVQEVEARGAQGLAVQTDVRFTEQIETLVANTVERFGRIDIVVNNAGAIYWQPVEALPVKRFDLMMQINYRAPFVLCRAAIPHLKRQGGHIINMSPPTRLGVLAAEDWPGRTAYLMSKFGMTHLTLGLAEELRPHGIAANSLWPAHIIDTQATRVFASMFGGEKVPTWYAPDLLADACVEIVQTDPCALTGQTLIAEEFLRHRGVSDLSRYEVPCPV